MLFLYFCVTLRYSFYSFYVFINVSKTPFFPLMIFLGLPFPPLPWRQNLSLSFTVQYHSVMSFNPKRQRTTSPLSMSIDEESCSNFLGSPSNTSGNPEGSKTQGEGLSGDSSPSRVLFGGNRIGCVDENAATLPQSDDFGSIGEHQFEPISQPFLNRADSYDPRAFQLSQDSAAAGDSVNDLLQGGGEGEEGGGKRRFRGPLHVETKALFGRGGGGDDENDR